METVKEIEDRRIMRATFSYTSFFKSFSTRDDNVMTEVTAAGSVGDTV